MASWLICNSSFTQADPGASANGFASVLPDQAQQQSAPALTLELAYQLAQQRNFTQRASRAGLEVSRADIRIAGYRPNPVFQPTAAFGPMTTQLGNPQQLGLTQVVEVGNKRRNRVLVAGVQQTINETQTALDGWQLRSQVRGAYLDWVAAQALLQLQQLQASLLTDLVAVAQKRFDAGAIPEAELLQVQLTQQQTGPVVNQARIRLDLALASLNELLGLSADTPQQSVLDPFSSLAFPEKEVASYEPDVLLAQAMNNRMEQKLRLQTEQLVQQQRKLVRSQRIPDVQVGAGYLFVYSTTPIAQTIGDKGFFQGGYTTVSVSLPVFNNKQGELQKTQAAQTEAALRRQATEHQIRTDVMQARVALQGALVSVEQYETSLLPHAEEVARLAQIGYRYGKTGLANVILAQQTVQQVRSSYLDALVAAWRGWGDLESAVGQPLLTHDPGQVATATKPTVAGGSP